MDRKDWIWMPHAAHFTCGQWCRFKLATYVGGFIVSTVGEYVPDEGMREILAKSRGIKLEGRGDMRKADYMDKIGFENVGADRKYETMVFRAGLAKDGEECGCSYRPTDWSELDFAGTNDPTEAYNNHMELCEKWATADPLVEVKEMP